jgi:hypothetical protein
MAIFCAKRAGRAICGWGDGIGREVVRGLAESRAVAVPQTQLGLWPFSLPATRFI